MKPVWVAGFGLWSTGFSDAASWIAGVPDGALVEPRATLIAPRLARRTSFLTRMAAEVLAQARAGADLAKVMSVYSSANGELRTLAALLEMLHGDGIYSPMRFQNSVHNTAAGHLSILTANPCFTTSLAAGTESVAMGLVESLALLEERGGTVIAVFADESPAGEFGLPAYNSLATAIHLSAEQGASRVRLENLRCVQTPIVRPPLPGLVENPCAASIPLIEQLQRGQSGTVPVSFGVAPWVIDLALQAEVSR